jgi:hypothetical protein
MLKAMQLLPDAKVTPATFANYFTDVKGKCKATDMPEDKHAHKRFADDGGKEGEGSWEAYGEDDDDDDLYGEQCMQLTDD